MTRRPLPTPAQATLAPIALGAIALGAALLAATAAGAQDGPRTPRPVPVLTTPALRALLDAQRPRLGRCAAQEGAYLDLATVRVEVRGVDGVSTLDRARLRVVVESRPRHRPFEACGRDRVRRALRRAPYAVDPGTLRASATMRFPPPPTRRRTPVPDAYEPASVHRALASRRPALQRCLATVGGPGALALRVAVERDGRLTLLGATPLPEPAVLRCLALGVGAARVAPGPGRRVVVVHRLAYRR